MLTDANDVTLGPRLPGWSVLNKRALISACAAGFAFSANYTNHAPMVSALRGDFGFSQASAGLLTTGIFLSHALMQIPGGRLSDRLGPSRVMIVALAWIALANFAIAFSGAYRQLLLCKTVAGVGTGACFAAGARYVVGMFQDRELHLAQGLYGASIGLGSGFVLFAVPQLLDILGWRGAFLACALLAAAVWAWWMWTAPVPQPIPPAAGLGGMMGHRELWLLGWMQMASFGLVIVVGTSDHDYCSRPTFRCRSRPRGCWAPSCCCLASFPGRWGMAGASGAHQDADWFVTVIERNSVPGTGLGPWDRADAGCDCRTGYGVRFALCGNL